MSLPVKQRSKHYVEVGPVYFIDRSVSEVTWRIINLVIAFLGGPRTD